MGKELIDKFWESRALIENPRLATQFKIDNSLEYDFELVKKYLPENARVLDMGCGTCTLTNKLIPHTSYLRGIDKQANLMNHCLVNGKFETKVANVTEYKDTSKYDMILLFGVLNYVTNDDIVRKIYKNCYEMLKDGGILIVKHQSGVEEDKEVNKYSEELKSDYYALYRYKKRDVSLLEEQSYQVQVIDIYPEHMNPWNNTHNYAYIAKK